LDRIDIETGDSLSAILVGANWEAVTKLLPDSNVIILTDDNLQRLYGRRFPGFPVISVTPGEGSKQLRVAEKICKQMLDAGIDRDGYLLAIGGGVVCDLAGFIASVYMRGLRCAYVSTSLLAQVDASTGGKTGVNLGKVKNVIGTFNQPEFVICDTRMLATLSHEEFLSGMAEVIKTAIIGREELIKILEANVTQILNRDRDLLNVIVAECVRFKASVVSEDEKEKGLRRILNFGHTFGHAVELNMGVKHGFAVAAGMRLSMEWSYIKGFLNRNDLERFSSLLKAYGLEIPFKISTRTMARLVRHDKKKSGDDLYFIFTCGPAKAIPVKITFNELMDFYKNYISVKN